MSLESLTFINFGPGTPGIVLDISEGGLRFRVLSPLSERQQVHFWFSADGDHIEADGKVVWIDGTKLEGGLCFQFKSPQPRDKIRNWMMQAAPSARAVAGNLVSKPVPSSSRESKALPDTSVSLAKITSAGMTSQHGHRNALRVYSQGLISGLLISAIVAVGIFFQTGRRHLGEMLIAVGQGLARKPPASLSSPSSTAVSRPYSELGPVSGTGNRSGSSISVSETPVVVSGISTTTPLPMLNPPHGPALISPSSTPGRKSAPPEILSSPAENAKPGPNHDLPDSAPLAGEPANTISAPEKYFEVRALRNGPEADKVTEALQQLGFSASVIRKGHLWGASYHVMVGPYMNDDEAEAARTELEAHGYQPVAGARHSRRFALPPMTLADQDTVVQDCIIAWDANSSAATVTFLKAGEVVLKAQGNWIKRNFTYKLDAVISTSAYRGPKTLLEIQCHGMNEALVFDRSRPIRYFIPPFRTKM